MRKLKTLINTFSDVKADLCSDDFLFLFGQNSKFRYQRLISLMRLSHFPGKKGILIKMPPTAHRTPAHLPRLKSLPKSEKLSLAQGPANRPDHEPNVPVFDGPVKPSYVIVTYPDYLTEREQGEIQQYREVYYVRREPPKSKKTSNVIPNFFHFCKGDHVAFRYEQEDVLGKGAFGSVLKCLDHKRGKSVAIKMLRDKPSEHSQIMFELNLLMKLQDHTTENRHNVIHYYEHFTFRGFFCIVMELLYLDVYTILKAQRFVGFKTPVVQIVAKETAEALQYVHSQGVVHCDIKPENILFTGDDLRHVKLIDFGCSCFVGNIIFAYVQSRYYRAPEVVLGMTYAKEVDMWSLGCLICEMLTGSPLLPARDEEELINMMVEMFGLPPKSMIRDAPRAHHYFDQNGQLKPNKTGKVYVPNGTTIQEATKIRDRELLSLIERCLTWSPSERITAQEFLEDSWITRVIPRDPQVSQSART